MFLALEIIDTLGLHDVFDRDEIGKILDLPLLGLSVNVVGVREEAVWNLC